VNDVPGVKQKQEQIRIKMILQGRRSTEEIQRKNLKEIDKMNGISPPTHRHRILNATWQNHEETVARLLCRKKTTHDIRSGNHNRAA
jgi:hypothetical protein